MSQFIQLQNQFGLAWQKLENFYFRGNCNFIIFEPTFENAFEFLKNSFGNFAWIYEDEQKIIFSTDTIRSYPIFYFFDGNEFFVSDNAHFLKEKFNPNFNQKQATFFKASGYTSGEETLLENVNCPHAFSFVEFDKTTKQLYKKVFPFELGLGVETYNNEYFEKLSTQLFKKLIEKLKGKKAIIPLSAGWDSRFILAGLIKNGYENIVCFTYGKRSSYEVKIAHQIAEKLNVEWHYVEYHKDTFELYKTALAWQYEMFASQYNTIAYEQDFFAIYQLKKEGKLPSEGVFLPGYCGDLLSGSKNLQHNPLRSDIAVSNYIIKNHFSKKIEQIHIVIELLNQSVKKVEKENYQTLSDEFNAAFENWYNHHKSNKFINNGVRCFEFFGYEWAVPFSFYSYMHFWEEIIYVDRDIERYFYKNNLNKLYFEPLEIDFENATTDQKYSSISNLLKDITPAQLKNPLKKLLLKGSEQDVNNLLHFGKMLQQDINLGEDFENENIAHARWLLKKLSS